MLLGLVVALGCSSDARALPSTPIAQGLRALVATGVPAAKMVVGLPFYGYEYIGFVRATSSTATIATAYYYHHRPCYLHCYGLC